MREDGEDFEISETAGGTVSMTFEASEDAAEYYCESHPDSMRGGVKLGQGFDVAPHEHGDHGHETDGNEWGDENSSE